VPPAADRHGPLAPEDIDFLALEGGGGKGVAFLGAIQALQDKGVLRFASRAPGPIRPTGWLPGEVDLSRRLLGADAGGLTGVAGSSAGAITALMLSCGYDAADIGAILAGFNFDTFFDPPTPRQVPRLFAPRPRESVVEPDALPRGHAEIDVVTDFLELFPELPDAASRRAPLAPESRRLWIAVWRHLLVEVVLPAAARAAADRSGHSLPKAATLVLDRLDDYLTALGRDMGLFSGAEARGFLADLVAFKMPLRAGRLNYQATFLEHYEHFRVELAVTGTNVETGKAGIFSRRTTPNLPVADAVRISMSLPIGFKPYVIRPEHVALYDLDGWLLGVWIDGGYLNNLPLHVFDQDGGVHHTLGLRLDAEAAPAPIADLYGFLGRYPTYFGVLGAGEAHVGPGSRNETQTIVLPTGADALGEGRSLDLLTFTYPPDVIRDITASSRRTVLAYFGDS
jgi:NTE family protein